MTSGIDLPPTRITQARRSADQTLTFQSLYSFAQCAPLVKAGKAIRYEGPGGPTSFDSFHDSTGIFQIDTYTPSGQVKVIGNISPAQLRALAG
jgi:hypothetical protein